MRLLGEGFSLRPLSPDDLGFIEELDSDPKVAQHLPGASEATRDDRRAWLESLHQPTPEEPWGFFALELEGSSDPIGWLHLRPEKDRPPFWDLGWRLKSEFWGRSLAVRAAGVLIAHAVKNLDAAHFSAQTLSANSNSIRVMEKLGMTRESTFLWKGQIPAERWVSVPLPVGARTDLLLSLKAIPDQP